MFPFPMMRQNPWWPAYLGQPNSSGSQNDTRYAYFGPARRLLIYQNGHTTMYDTGDNWITGVSQCQSNQYSYLRLMTPNGELQLSNLKVVEN